MASPPQPSGTNFLVVSWNVLHIVHELHHVPDASPVLDQYMIKDDYANEQKRLKDIVIVLEGILRDHRLMECFVCLQEVPGDLIPMLQEMLDSTMKPSSNGNAILYQQAYSRRPRLRNGKNEALYRDMNEYLVTIHYQPTGQSATNAPRISWTPCPVDQGKGALGLTLSSGLTILNIHVPYDYRAADALLAHLPWPTKESRFLMVGDMNRGSGSMAKAMEKVTRHPVHCVASEKNTRVGMNEKGVRRYMNIDYFVVSPALLTSVVSRVKVIDDIGDISDHFPILLELTNKLS